MASNMELKRKVFGVKLVKASGSSSEGFVTVRGFFTSDNKDEVGDIITRAATERAIGKYRQWGNIRYMHQPRPVGKVLRIGSQDGLEWNEIEIKVVDPQAAFEVENGLLSALSVGIIIKFEDIDFLEDGGWIINDYSLAEISLVDHPANYDAALTVLNGEGMRSLVRELGLTEALRSYQACNLQLGEKQMPEENKDITPQDLLPVVPAVAEPVIEESLVDEPAAEEIETDEHPSEPEVVPTETEAAAEPDLVPETDAEGEGHPSEPAVEEEVEGESSCDGSADPQPSVEQVRMLDILAQLSVISERVEALEKAQVAPVRSKSEAEGPEANPPVTETLDTQALKARIADLETEIAELRAPVERKGFVPGGELPHEAVQATGKTQDQEDHDDAPPAGADRIRLAAKRYLTRN